MSRHEGVSCDSCLIGNFRGRRYKCLICYDYDLCAACYEGGATNTRHTTDHPMQCIITRADFDFFYGGEALTSLELPQSYTCPYCSRMGFTDVTLQEHVSADHVDTSFEVVCPLCAAMPGGDPNLMTDDFAGHLTLEHRTGPRDLISFLDEPVGTRHNVRRIPHNATHMGRGAAALRPRRSNMHFRGRAYSFMRYIDDVSRRTADEDRIAVNAVNAVNAINADNTPRVFSSGGLSSLSPSSRETVDPIAELLSQLSGVRRSASNTNSSTPTQLQQLQMQLQLERQQVNAARQQLERFPRRQTQSQTSLRESHASSNSGTSTLMLNPSPVLIQQPSSNAPSMPSPQSQFLLIGLLEELSLQSTTDMTRQDRSQFVQELVLSSAVHRDKKESNEKPNTKSKTLKNTEVDKTEEVEEVVGSRPQRQGNVVLRGRARSDAQNSRRRADANREVNLNGRSDR